MRARYLLIGLVMVLAAVTGVLIYQGNQTGTTASASPVTITADHAPADGGRRDRAPSHRW